MQRWLLDAVLALALRRALAGCGGGACRAGRRRRRIGRRRATDGRGRRRRGDRRRHAVGGDGDGEPGRPLRHPRGRRRRRRAAGRSTNAPTRTASRASSCRRARLPGEEDAAPLGRDGDRHRRRRHRQRHHHGGAGFAVDTERRVVGVPVSVRTAMPDVWLRDVTLTRIRPDLVGRLRHEGSLGLRRARVTGFRAGGVVATCLPASGCDHEADSNQATTLHVLGSLIDGNRSAGKGGGISSEGSGAAVLVAHSAIVNNASDNDGGGIYLGGGWSTNIIQSSTISGNTTSGVGGGLLVRFAEMTNTYVHIFTSTIANNTAAGTGGGIEFEPAQVGRRRRVGVREHRGGELLAPSTLEWNINAAWSPPRPPGVFNCVNGSFIYVAPGYPRPTDMGGARSTFATRSWARSCRMGGEGNLPLHPLLRRQPGRRRRAGRQRARRAARRLDRRLRSGDARRVDVFDPLVDGDGDGTPCATSAPTSATIAGRRSCWPCARRVRPRTRRDDPRRVRSRRRHDVRRRERDERVRDLRAPDRGARPLRRDHRRAHATPTPGSSRSRSRTIRRARGPPSGPSRTATARRRPSPRWARSRRRCSRRRARSWCASP